MSFFTITHKEKHSRARTGIIKTDHGAIETPCFMPVGTQGTVKALDVNDLHTLDAQIILGNTYHLHLRPGEDLVAEFGGLHSFMGWDGPILTDSGGFQVFSLGHKKNAGEDTPKNNQSKLVRIDEDGVTFKSYIDGSTHRFTPESAIDIQHKLGADIIMAFDECTPDDVDMEYAKQAMERTHRWAKRCIAEQRKQMTQSKPALFGIMQGAKYKNLRIESAKVISAMDFDGIAIGGESIGYNMDATKEILSWVIPIIPEEKPHYTMGVGFSPLDLFDVVEQGIDMFDCVAQTRIARNGSLYVSPAIAKQEHQNFGTKDRKQKYRINILNARYAKDASPIDSSCACFTCLTHSRAYIHHLFRAEELLAYRLTTIHNVHFFLQLMRDMQDAICQDRFLAFKKEWQ